MTEQNRSKFAPEFKVEVPLEAAKDQSTLVQLSQKFEVNVRVDNRPDFYKVVKNFGQVWFNYEN